MSRAVDRKHAMSSIRPVTGGARLTSSRSHFDFLLRLQAKDAWELSQSIHRPVKRGCPGLTTASN